jgi:anti-sigma factor RsiW
VTCADVEKLVHPYVDGEFDTVERVAFEAHLAGCRTCRELVGFQTSFKASLRARVRRPEPPPELRGRILGALDQADAAGDGPAPPLWRRAIPLTALAAIAAAVALFVGTSLSSRAASPIVEEAVRGHEKHLPVEVGGTEENVKSWMVGKVSVPVRPPRIDRSARAVLVGARLHHLRNRDAAQLVYRITDGQGRPGGDAQVTVYVFDAEGVPLEGRRQVVMTGRGGAGAARELYTGESHGHSVVLYRDRGVGYAFTSDMGPEELIRLVSASLD